VLISLVTPQVVTTREAGDVIAAGDVAVQHSLWRRGLIVGALVSLAVFGVEEALVADGALVRPLRPIEVSLRMTPEGMSMSSYDRQVETYLRSHDRSNVFAHCVQE
jgi:hypothetical protein